MAFFAWQLSSDQWLEKAIDHKGGGQACKSTSVDEVLANTRHSMNMCACLVCACLPKSPVGLTLENPQNAPLSQTAPTSKPANCKLPPRLPDSHNSCPPSPCNLLDRQVRWDDNRLHRFTAIRRRRTACPLPPLLLLAALGLGAAPELPPGLAPLLIRRWRGRPVLLLRLRVAGRCAFLLTLLRPVVNVGKCGVRHR